MKGYPRRTVKGGTTTTKGHIKNLPHQSGKFDMPIKCTIAPNSVNGHYRPPLVKAGFLIYALPGKGEFVSKYTLSDIKRLGE